MNEYISGSMINSGLNEEANPERWQEAMRLVSNAVNIAGDFVNIIQERVRECYPPMTQLQQRLVNGAHLALQNVEAAPWGASIEAGTFLWKRKEDEEMSFEFSNPGGNCIRYCVTYSTITDDFEPIGPELFGEMDITVIDIVAFDVVPSADEFKKFLSERQEGPFEVSVLLNETGSFIVEVQNKNEEDDPHLEQWSEVGNGNEGGKVIYMRIFLPKDI